MEVLAVPKRYGTMLATIVIWMEGKAKDWAEMMANIETIGSKKNTGERFAKAKELRIFITAFKEKALENGHLTVEIQKWI